MPWYNDWKEEKIRIEGKDCILKSRNGTIKVTCGHRYVEVYTTPPEAKRLAGNNAGWKKEMKRLRLEAINKMQGLLQKSTKRRR